LKNRTLKTLATLSARGAASASAVWTPPVHMCSDLDGCASDAGALMPTSVHWRNAHRNNVGEVDVRMPHPAWSKEEREAVGIEHTKPETLVDRAAYATIWVLRRVYDLATGYTFGEKDEACMIRRVVFLETVAAVPGMVGAALRHLKSLRRMRNDYGFIHSLLEEAENERMHLMTALLLHEPSKIVRAAVIAAQAVFLAWYTTMYAISPRFCHRLVGYLEEEAVKTYTFLLHLQDTGKLPGFDIPAPKATRAYWNLPDDATLREVWDCIRADEAHHREVNHTFADLTNVPNAVNPFPPGY
jgi:hypothetical protein